MTVYFIGAGPGDPELITVKGQRLVREADLVLYAGSLVPRAIVDQAKEGARVVDSAPLNLDETHALLRDTVRAGGSAARVHTGDPALYGAIREQMLLLDQDEIPYEVVPGVTAAFAAASVAKMSLTVPEKTQTLILTRTPGRTPMPEGERLRDLARHRCTLAVYLSAGDAQGMVDELKAGGLEGSTPVLVAHHIGWEGAFTAMTTLDAAPALVAEKNCTRQTVFVVLPGEDGEAHFSKLYDPTFAHGFRP